MTYKETLQFLENTRSFGSILGLERICKLLEYLDHPEQKLRFVHITGTNGKGSTSAYLANILIAAGYNTGRFNSPFIQRFSEQIHFNREEISDDDLCSAATIVKKAYDRMLSDGFGSTTEFETVFVIALQYFLQKKCDIVILEVGMGGKGDATNVIPCPEVAVFAHIALDHAAFLGNTLEDIAREKAGIIKSDCNVVTTEQSPEVLAVLMDAYLQTSMLPADPLGNGPDFRISQPSSIRLLSASIKGQTFSHPAIPLPLETSLCGRYQLTNAALAIETALSLIRRGWTITGENVLEGIRNTRWPGRFELLDTSSVSPKNISFLIDGAHNPDGIAALAESLQQYFPDQKLIMITGVLADKDYRNMLSRLLPFAQRFHCITVPNPRALPAEELAQVLQELGAVAIPHESVSAAIDAALSEAGENDAILAFGSLYYIGQVRSYLFS